MGRKSDDVRVGMSTRRLFGLYAIASLIPVVLLGVLLSSFAARQADSRGLAQARDQAALIAQTSVAPQLSGEDLRRGLTVDEAAALQRTVGLAVATGQIDRLRLRSLDGRVVFSDDGSGLGSSGDDDAEKAADGQVVSELTRLNSDSNDHGPAGARVVEVYEPLLAAQTGERIGVLELYLPYEPIAGEMRAGRQALTLRLGFGLGLLWLTLLLVSFSTTRRLRREAARNAYLAAHDTLTGLPNRSTFHQRVQQALASATATAPTAVVVLDVDRFSDINDTLGHRSGDQLLEELAERLRCRLREGDLVARLGGDQFGIVLANLHGAGEAVEVLSRLRAAVSDVVQLADLPVSVEASMGFALAPEDGTDAEQLLRRADQALVAARRHNVGVVHYRPEHDSADVATLALVAELRSAIEHGQLVLHYQPKVDTQKGTVIGLEALVRWQHPTRGLLYPDAFLPAVEQTELIEALTRWVLQTATTALQLIDPSGLLSMSVNVSARSLVRPGFAQDVLAVLRSCDVAVDRVILEVTETALVSDPSRARQNLRELHDAGVRVSIDDFGAGQTSLGYLATLPISELKIDKGFVLTMTEDERNAAIVRSVIELGHSLGFAVTAEGVETRQTLDELKAARCDTVQGYLLSRPVDLPAVLECLSTFESAGAPFGDSAGVSAAGTGG